MAFCFHEPGVYFSMPEDEYFADASLGSTDMKRLFTSPAEYWYLSPLNPFKIEKEDTPSLIFGRACHKIVLEGEGAFMRLYGPVDQPGNTKLGKTEREVLEIAGKTPLKRDDWDRINIAGAAIRNNPFLVDAFSSGIGSEVSIFWRDRIGIPKKARIDKLKLRANVDLKTIAPKAEREFPEACRMNIASYRYDMQAAHYSEGREHIAEFVQQGLVHGPHDAELLKAVAASKTWASVIVFLKSTGAPLTWGVQYSPANPVMEIARRDLEFAAARYENFRLQYGLETPWLEQHPLEEAAIEDMPYYYLKAGQK